MKITKTQLKQLIKEELEEQLEEKELNEVDMNQAQPIIDAFVQVLAAIPYAVSPALIAYAFKQAVDRESEERAVMGDRRPLFGRRKEEETK
tara:strand:+ start:187 stop:459 length:273 start_codon:yes stop_codon:yes gene_type:complete